ncbi:MAG: 4-diphosphocytidyl-2-C-methyl-D-erythritol kinase [bacterium P3]|nr:MAG: 4-diphosphocytidyl-2-C-methyl-D-erythritol kinase [bacterium P3]KWW42606.1 MAG: 4-diphosphocytidyl-2-C-methyl-D-erythritol kinase [bacterium F083]
MRSYPNCKINLGLQILSRRPDGYHDIATVMLPVSGLHDTLDIDLLPTGDPGQPRFEISGTAVDCDDDQNTCLRAYHLMRTVFPGRVSAVSIRLHKAIPHGAGLGGGSSDAAFTLRMLNVVFGLQLDDDALCQLALRIGADCPFFIRNRPAYVTGIGDRIEQVDFDLQRLGLRVEVVKPDVSVSTREAYAGTTPRPAIVDLRDALRQPVDRWRDLIVNDFETSVMAQHPSIAQLKQDFYARGARYASMSGSGSAVFGLFDIA